jgi:hypothetical protein
LFVVLTLKPEHCRFHSFSADFRPEALRAAQSFDELKNPGVVGFIRVAVGVAEALTGAMLRRLVA